MWRLGEKEVEVIWIRGKEFVSRKTGHRLVEDFKSSDFGYWYDAALERTDYVLEGYVKGEDMRPIMTTGFGPSILAAVGEIPMGKGSLIVSQLKASTRVEYEPIAAAFYQAIIDYGRTR